MVSTGTGIVIFLFLLQVSYAAAAAAAAAATYKNPVVRTNAPDPGVLLLNGTYWMVSTAGSTPTPFPMRSSSDLVNWKDEGSTFKSAPSCEL